MSRRGSLIDQVRRSTASRQWARAVRRRDGRCLGCGGGEGLTAHHVEPLAAMLARLAIRTLEEARARADELWPMTNGVTLCRDCHDEADAREARRQSAAGPDDAAEFGFVAAVVSGEGVVVAGVVLAAPPPGLPREGGGVASVYRAGAEASTAEAAE